MIFKFLRGSSLQDAPATAAPTKPPAEPGEGFCTTCGKQNTLQWDGTYRADDGARKMVSRCPDSCRHNRHFHIDVGNCTLWCPACGIKWDPT